MWSNTNTWTGGVVPGANDDVQVTFDGAARECVDHEIVVNVPVAVASLTVLGATLNCSGIVRVTSVLVSIRSRGFVCISRIGIYRRL